MRIGNLKIENAFVENGVLCVVIPEEEILSNKDIKEELNGKNTIEVCTDNEEKEILCDSFEGYTILNQIKYDFAERKHYAYITKGSQAENKLAEAMERIGLLEDALNDVIMNFFDEVPEELEEGSDE